MMLALYCCVSTPATILPRPDPCWAGHMSVIGSTEHLLRKTRRLRRCWRSSTLGTAAP